MKKAQQYDWRAKVDNQLGYIVTTMIPLTEQAMLQYPDDYQVAEDGTVPFMGVERAYGFHKLNVDWTEVDNYLAKATEH